MKTKLFLILLTVTALVFTGHSQTNNSVQLTADQIAKLDGGINNLIPLLPASCQPYVIKSIAIIGLLGIVGRALSGFFRAGAWGAFTGLFGGHNGPLNPPPQNVAKGASGLVRMLLLFGLLSFCIVGCKSYQAVKATHGKGLKVVADVPIPYSGGESLLGLSLWFGTFDDANIWQPTSTNSVGAPSVAVNMGQKDNANVMGNATSTTTNGNASITGGDTEHFNVLTGQSTENSTNLILTTGQK